MSYQSTPYPELTWSTSRVSTLEKCEREYFYTYYGAHNGWEESTDPYTKEVYKFKKMTNKDILAGNMVHEKAKDFINLVTSSEDFVLTPSALERHINVAIFKFRNSCIQSKSYNSSWDPKIKGFDMLNEYFYGDDITKYDGEKIKGLLTKCICNVALSHTFEDIHINKLTVLENSKEDFPSFIANNTKIFALLDLLYVNSDGKYVIVDWKTGSEDEKHRLQMLVYARYVVETYAVNVKDIVCRLEYLSQGTYKEYQFSYDDLSNLDTIINSNVERFMDYLDDTSLNKAKDITHFKTTEDISGCKNCKYKGLCI
ncbi:PD-(D/E)XK nuclease family protein [Romboutsia sp. 1001713B170207_170306_H8]|uniref:PD-(D/E)XK nuclease family protein n=1 Tax=Romboutsia sp. 1001713B170207_170306_H8 TaxID=2787112 RepID=UPI00189BB663|nr:PD-(D/E)XK nuclease family protein [Romboutsia sp. 1001713B170207_170306_H8]